MREAASRGYFLGSKAPFGYQRIKVSDGVKECPTLEVDPVAAPVVKEIFESSRRGNGLKEICKELNNRGITNLGRRWQKNVVHYLLTNEAYTGTAVWGVKSKDEKAPEPVRVENAWPALVSRETFAFEANTRRKNAEEGIARLKDHVDTLIVIPNDRLLHLNQQNEQTFTWEDALRTADTVLQQGIQAIAEVVTVPGEINVDFADVKTILSNAGPAWLAVGRGKGESRAVDAAKMATKSPLLDIAMDGAKRILFVVSGGPTLSLKEVQDAANVIQEMSDPDANIIFGTSRDPKLDDDVKITMVAAAFPVIQETQGAREAELERLLQDVIPESEEELDVPSFLRRQSSGRNRGFFR